MFNRLRDGADEELLDELQDMLFGAYGRRA